MVLFGRGKCREGANGGEYEEEGNEIFEDFGHGGELRMLELTLFRMGSSVFLATFELVSSYLHIYEVPKALLFLIAS